MARFYGWSLESTREMDVQDLHFADLAVRQIDAQERLVEAKISMLPNMKKEHIDKFVKALHREAYPEVSKKKRQITLKELQEMMNVGR